MNARQRKKRLNYDPYKKWHLNRRHFSRYHRRCPFCGKPCKRRTGYIYGCPDCWWKTKTLRIHVNALTNHVHKMGYTLIHRYGDSAICFSLRVWDSMGNLHLVDRGLQYSDLLDTNRPLEEVLSEEIYELIDCL